MWTDGDNVEHLTYVSSVLKVQGWMNPEIIAEDTRSDGVMGLFG